MRRRLGKRSRKKVRTIYNFDIVVMVIVMMMTMGKMIMMITVNDDVDELMRMLMSFDDYREGILC